MKRWNWRSAWMGWLRGGLLMPCLALLASGGELRAQGPRDDESQTVRGTVESMTTAPKGEIDGAVLDDGTVLHWPPHLEDQFSSVVAKGDRVKAVGWTETGRKRGTRFEVQTVTNLETNATAENDERGRREKRKERPRAGREGPQRTIHGTVQRLTKAPKGEIDGAVLDDGVVLHWPPHLEDRFADLIAVGDRVKVAGFEDTGKKGRDRFEVQSLTNLRTNRSVENDDRGRPPRREPSRGRLNEASSRAERIRQLKEEAERLEREIERLEREP
jgi:hypothetical protein